MNVGIYNLYWPLDESTLPHPYPWLRSGNQILFLAELGDGMRLEPVRY